MADACGLPKRSLENYMNLRAPQRPGLDAMLAVADGMEVSLDWLTGRAEEELPRLLNRDEYALACFNAVLRMIHELLDEATASGTPVLTAQGFTDERNYQIAAKAMLSFRAAVEDFEKSGHWRHSRCDVAAVTKEFADGIEDAGADEK
jgi:transcriptional regulator with XRE-family HTH domain